MGQKKTILTSLLVQLLLVVCVVVGLYGANDAKMDPTRSDYRMYVDVPEAWPVLCWHNALFAATILWLGFGGMMFVAATDFFDIFGYAFSSLLVLFSPLKSPKEHKHFYEYKQMKAEKRKKEAERKAGNLIPLTMVIMGVILLLASIVLFFVHEDMVAPWYEAHADEITTAYDYETDELSTEDVEDPEAEEAEELEADEDDTDEPASDEVNPTDETTGGENNE